MRCLGSKRGNVSRHKITLPFVRSTLSHLADRAVCVIGSFDRAVATNMCRVQPDDLTMLTQVCSVHEGMNHYALAEAQKLGLGDVSQLARYYWR